MTLPDRFPIQFIEPFVRWQGRIRTRLDDFSMVSEDRWFYELCFCLLTPQSKAVHADAVVQQLQQMHFYEHGGDPEPILRHPTTYIRFHHQKAERLRRAREEWMHYHATISEAMVPDLSTDERRLQRDRLARTIDGFGMKEASHFLRNIGARQLGILDRHILRYLVLCGIYESVPAISSPRAYRQVEDVFSTYAALIGYDMDELDLFFWSQTTGLILK